VVWQGDFVTVVSGVPRSGTSLVMQMLAAGGVPVFSDGVRQADDDNPRGYFEHEAVKASARDASWLAAASGRAVKVIHALIPHLPDGPELRVLFVEREMSELLQSQARMIERMGGSSRVDDEATARAFAAQVEAALAQLAARPRTAVLRLEHRELLAAPLRQAERMDVFLGEGLDREAMAACVDPALHRQRGDPESEQQGQPDRQRDCP